MRLKWIGIGSGRDGTVSLNKLLNQLFESRQTGWRSYHEYGSRDCYNGVAEIRENGTREAVARLRSLLENCEYEAIVGNGYAFALPYLIDLFQDRVKIIHLQRQNVDACVSSLVTDCVMFPEAYGYYSDDPKVPFAVKRTAAFHFGEMTREQWNALSINHKFLWYYRKTHALIEEYRPTFADSLHLHTEDLSEKNTVASLARFLDLGTENLPDPVHLNSHFYVDLFKVDPFYRTKMQWLFREFDCNRSSADDLYALRYFLDRFIAWMGYQINGTVSAINPEYAQPPDILFDKLDEAFQLLQQRMIEFQDLRFKAAQKMVAPPAEPERSETNPA